MSAELEDIHEECGIFGVWGHSDAARLTYFGLHALQHRGQEGAGIVSNDNGHLIGHRGTGLLTQVFSDEREIERLKGDKAIGHVRYATAGSGGTDNIQPFIFRFHDGGYGVVSQRQSHQLPPPYAASWRTRERSSIRTPTPKC